MIDQIQKTLAKIDPQTIKGSKESTKGKDIEVSNPILSPAEAFDSANLSKLAKSDNVSGLAISPKHYSLEPIGPKSQKLMQYYA